MDPRILFLIVSMSSSSLAQSSTSGGLGAFLSDAYSVVSQVKSIVTETASPSTTRSSASSTSSPSSSSPSSSTAPSSLTSTSTPLKSVLPTSTQQNAASDPTATPSDAPPSHHGINKLAVILGVVIGVLVLLVLILLVFCCIRRRRRRTRTSRRVVTPDDDEFDAWRTGHHRESLNSGWRPNGANGNYTHVSSGGPSTTAAPDLSHHPAFRNETEMSQPPANPFVPVPPAPRRSAPNSRAGLTDTSQPGQEPFLKRHAGATAAAAGIGGAALGAAAANHHNNRKSSGSQSPHGILRKPLPRDSYEKLGQHPPPEEAYIPSRTNPYDNPYSHKRNESSADAAPLISSHDPEKHTYDPNDSAALPTHYTSERPATPMGLMAFGGNGKSNHNHNKPAPRPTILTDSDTHSTTSQSYDSARSTASGVMGPPAARKSPAHSVTPPTPARSPNKRTRFSDSVEEWDGTHEGDQTGSSGAGSRTDSGERLSGSMPGGWSERGSRGSWNSSSGGVVGSNGNGERKRDRDSRRRSAGGPGPMITGVDPGMNARPGGVGGVGMGMKRHSQGAGPGQGRRLRLSDLRAEEEEKARLRAAGGSGGSGYGHGRGQDHDDGGWENVDVGRAY